MKIKEIIEKIKFEGKCNKYYNAQMNVDKKEDNEDFLRYLKDKAEYIFVDELGGTPPGETKTSCFRRYRIEKTFDEVIHCANKGIGCGIKVIPNPLWKLYDWDKWEDGYVEGFVRMDSDDKFVEWFIWLYIKMEYLEDILEEFKDKLSFVKI